MSMFPPLTWKTGDWWIVQTRFVANQAEMLDEPEQLGFFSYYHLFQVAGKEELEGIECRIIDIFAFNVPPEEQNDHGNEYLWRLYCNSDDMTLRRLIINSRMGPYLISGDLTSDTVDYQRGNPVIVAGTPLLVPLDIPKMPFRELLPYMPEEFREIGFLDEHSMQEYSQYASIMTTVEKKALLFIKFWDTQMELRIQIWQPGLPWWSRCRLETTGSYKTGIRDAFLITSGTVNEKPMM